MFRGEPHTAELRIVVGGLDAYHRAREATHEAVLFGFDTPLASPLLALFAGPLPPAALQLLPELGHCLLAEKNQDKDQDKDKIKY
jgi:hypothetical protein